MAKLLQKYQERVDALDLEIDSTEEDIDNLKEKSLAMQYKRQVWLDAIAEINAD